MTSQEQRVEEDNSDRLRILIEESGFTQNEALARFNRGQARKMALRTLKSYLASRDAKTRINCSEAILERMKKVLR
jgi:ABC-type thiamine transport system substrate-binding protein